MRYIFCQGTYLGDADKIRQVLINLIGNAIKFTTQGNIKIIIYEYQNKSELKANEIELYFGIQDTGMGISEVEQKKLFNRFSQIETSKNYNLQGTGLGLSICKKIVELMSGQIGVESIPEQGSKFWFTVKLEYVDKPVDKSSLKANNNHQTKNIPQSILIKIGKILVAEDNQVNQKVIKNQLKRIGYDCDIVENGQVAINKLQKESYNLILMDCQMPILDGYDATKIIRHQEANQNIIIIALSASAMTDDKQKCLNAGMNDYLSKPCSIDELQTMIIKWIGKNESLTK
ncbi:MAG: response regulator [Sphaerospermopsis sp. SIO1G2]|nr:response regulator [Sphaerospermopsis sp. SIO1G2]